MSSSTKVPGPSAEERALQASQAELLGLQTQILKQQQQQQAVLLPFLAEQEGFQVETDEFGNITSISKTPSENETKAKQLESEMLDRSLAALRGELPVSPGLERDITKQGETLRERLAAQFGPGYETSTPGIETLARFEESANIAREGARTGQLTLAEQLGIARGTSNLATRQAGQAVLGQGAVGTPLTLAGAFGGAAAGYGKAQEPFIQHRNMQLQASLANAKAGNPFATIAGTAIGAYFSDARLKTDITPVGVDMCPGIPIYTFRFNWDVETMGEAAPTRLGLLAQDVQKLFPEAVGEVDGYLTIDRQLLSNLTAMHKLDHSAAVAN